ncbi:MAG: helix-turn-helix domain-containing protein [Steroidobacteraceae bacterium]|jgi:DNA-binding transcriptional ArsR family regulator
MKTPDVIEALAALAHEHRLAIYRLLVQRGPEGLSAGTIGQRIGLLPSSLTFHLQNLQRAGLITQRRESRQLFYSVDFSVMSGLVGYLTENCCGNSSTDCSASCAPVAPAKGTKRAAKVA